MSLDLTSVQAKVDHSATHLDALEDKVEAWMNGKFNSIERQTNSQFTEHSFIYRCSKEPDVISWSLMFGDCIHNLRTALDHLVYSVAVHESQKAIPPRWRQLAFPIIDDPDDFPEFRKNKLRHISDDVVTAIESMQPYKRPHPYLLPLLGLLRDFDDADKHRLLQLAVTQAVEWQFDNLSGFPPGPIKTIPRDVRELKDNTKDRDSHHHWSCA